ncbi:hypothetical protein [Parapedobacter sp. DT-150]|uniref:hypothetical protein n=1 Tax=Parapedobacter sp. DT-150 TaxID=3396162 RepID=UPI003F1BD2EF
MKKSFIIYALAAVVIAACTTPSRDDEPVKTLDLGHRSAVGPYFTSDHHGKPVLCWTETNGHDSTYRLAFASYDIQSGDFGPATVVAGSEGIGTSAESMGKVAFKDDGTIVAIFAKPFEQEKNPFAGAIYYTVSTDSGASWSVPLFLHSDTAHHYGRNFFDIARLGNGEIGAVWLDGRGESIEGSTLYFAATTPDQGFTGETVLHRGTCECCRTDLLVDDSGAVHVAYRSLQYPAARFGEQVRDMAYVRSEDTGRSFTAEVAISADNWAIRACPHTGPTLAAEGGRLHALWFTAGGNAGLYYTHTSPQSGHFGKRALLTSTGSHPQWVAAGADTLVAVYEDFSTPRADHAAHGITQGHHHHEHAEASGGSRILLQPIIAGRPVAPIPLSTGKAANHHPVITRVHDRLLVAWVCEENGRKGIAYRETTARGPMD